MFSQKQRIEDQRNNLMNKFYLFFIIFLFSSCYREELLDINQPSTKKQLVLHSLITPDADSIFVLLGVTNGELNMLFDTAFVLPDALVTFSDGYNQIILHKLQEKPAVYGCSQLEFPIAEGETYSVSANVAGYNGIKASTTVPINRSHWISPNVPLYYIRHNENFFDSYEYLFRSQWETHHDNLSRNYFAYRTGGICYHLKYSPQDSIGYRGFHQKVVDSSFFQLGLESLQKLEMDQIANTKLLNFLFSTSIFEDFASEYYNPGNSWVVSHANPSGNIYRNLTFYIITADNHYSALLDQPEMTEQYPFSSFSGVFPHYSSVSGGYGLFGSYLIDSVYFILDNPVNLYEPIKK